MQCTTLCKLNIELRCKEKVISLANLDSPVQSFQEALNRNRIEHLSCNHNL